MRRAALLLATLALGAGGPDDVLAALAHPSSRVRDAALAGLGTADPALLRALAGALASPDPHLRGAAALALARLGSPALPTLEGALGGPGEGARVSAAIALGHARLPASAPALGRALADPSPRVREAAAAALGNLGPAARAQAPALTALLPDGDEAVRQAAAQALLLMDPQGTARPGTLEATTAGIARLLPVLMAEHHVPGVAVALVKDRRLAWSRGFGVREAGKPDPVTPGTVFEACSMSKPALGLVALALREAGRLDLDRPLDAYGPESQVPDLPGRHQVTARMALAHTTGYPNWRPGGEEGEGPLPLAFRPGSRFSYSGEGIFHLQRALERIADAPLEALAERELFGPLALKATGFAWTEPLGALQATGHDGKGLPRPRSRYLHANGAYTLYTSAEDYARLLAEVLQAWEGRSPVIARRSVREALTRQVRLDGRDPIERPGAARGQEVYWGLGWSLNATAQGDIAHHGGSNQTGFRCFSQFSPARGTALVVFTNGAGGGELWTRLVAAFGDW